MNEYNDKLLDHDYDGIKELDNDLPRWWVGLFVITIIWSVGYVIYYHFLSIGYLQIDEYKQEMNPNYVRSQSAGSKLFGILPEYHSPFYNPKGDETPRLKNLESEAMPIVEITRESDTVVYITLTDEASLSDGERIYLKNCASCHGKLGEGWIGPNLTDKNWIHEFDMTGVAKSIKYGYPVKGMIAWRGFLKEDQIIKVASYVLTLKGSNPPNQKPPEGELIEEL